MKNIVINAQDIFKIDSNFEPQTKMLSDEVFGPFLGIAKETMVMFDIGKGSNRPVLAKVVQFLLLLVGLALILPKGFSIGSKMNDLPLFSFNWAWTFIFAFYFFHGAASLIILFIKSNNGFFDKYLEKMSQVIQEKEPLNKPKFQRLHILLGIFMLYLFMCFCIFNLDNSMEYDKYVLGVENSTAYFRKPLFGSESFYFLDILMMLWVTFINGIAMCLFICCFKKVKIEYEKFNEGLRKALGNSKNDTIFELSKIETHHNKLLDLIKFNNEEWSFLSTHAFLVGFLMQIMSGFLMRSFMSESDLIMKIMIMAYMVLSGIIMLMATKLPSDIYSLLEQTKDILLSNQILSKDQNEKIMLTIDFVIKKVQNPMLNIYVMNCFKLTPRFQAGAMLLFGILIEFFNAYKKEGY